MAACLETNQWLVTNWLVWRCRGEARELRVGQRQVPPLVAEGMWVHRMVGVEDSLCPHHLWCSRVSLESLAGDFPQEGGGVHQLPPCQLHGVEHRHQLPGAVRAGAGD